MQKLGDYEFLITLYHSKNLTQAAQALFVSQPALTKRLQQIEHELDTVIVYRNVKGVQFTPEGGVYCPVCHAQPGGIQGAAAGAARPS